VSLCLIHGDARYLPLADNSVHCCITSPPYYGLRDYGVSGQIGLESTPEAYVQALVQVFREVKRVLRHDGTLWCVLGDSYAGHSTPGWQPGNEAKNRGHSNKIGVGYVHNLKPKDLLGIPWRTALALEADGWYLRSDIIWHKPNPMPESVTDRPTKAHEYVFLLTKAARYYYDAAAIHEPAIMKPQQRFTDGKGPKGAGYAAHRQATGMTACTQRHARTVWTIPTTPYSGLHFATFPPALVERCVKAGTSAYGCCTACGAPWIPAIERTRLHYDAVTPKTAARIAHHFHGDRVGLHEPGWRQQSQPTRHISGWHPTCRCGVSETRPAIVLDPFCGSGTTPLVARALGRHAIGLDLSWPYLHNLARQRLSLTALTAWILGAPPRHHTYHDLPLFREQHEA